MSSTFHPLNCITKLKRNDNLLSELTQAFLLTLLIAYLLKALLAVETHVPYSMLSSSDRLFVLIVSEII